MNKPLVDQVARDRFRDEWRSNFAVSANAGSGKTTAISERLAAMALDADGARLLPKTAVVTFTRKAAAQIGRRARAVLVRRLAEQGRTDLTPLDQLERAFFGTIHSFCLLLVQRHGQTLGLNLNPQVVADDDEALWEEFLEQDRMTFEALRPEQTAAFLRHAPLETIFDLARRLDRATARRLAGGDLPDRPPEPSTQALATILAATAKGRGAEGLKANQTQAREWLRRLREERGFLPVPKPVGTAAGIRELYAGYFAPVKAWLASAGGTLAGELALRYRAWRFDRGVQTYADQIEAALAVLQDEEMLRRIREDGWRVILDEAQDTDPQQFAVLVEIAREPDAMLGTWPAAGGAGPRAGHFCMVGDGQQSIYGSRADFRNFQRHVAAFAQGNGGEMLLFDVTFRAPRRLAEWLNATLPAAFGAEREHNVGLPAAEGAPAPLLQVRYEPLMAAPGNEEGAVSVLSLTVAGEKKSGVNAQLALEARQVAAWLRAHGPAGVGASGWGEICLLAPRNDWLLAIRKEIEAAGLKTSLQIRRNRNGDNPAYAWMTGLLAALCDPENAFEWTGVLREVLAVSDAVIATELRRVGRLAWDEPERHDEPVRAALALLRPFVERIDVEGESLAVLVEDLAEATGLRVKAALIDPSGGLGDELDRLIAQATEAGLQGTTPREWLGALLNGLDEGRPAGKPQGDAVNLLTVHSAKGLEWPVVIAMGLWRSIGKREESGLRCVPDATGETRVFFDRESLPAATREARERERQRELARLLYVAVTRARRHLVLPWGDEFARAAEGSFQGLWGCDMSQLPLLVAPKRAAVADGTQAIVEAPAVERVLTLGKPVEVPQRLLPHQMARKPDAVREAKHETNAGELVGGRPDDVDPVDYGTWWHETMEFLPWHGSEDDITRHLAGRLIRADNQGFGARAEEELRLLRKADIWQTLRSAEVELMAELSVMGRLSDGVWIDGVIDLMARNRRTGLCSIVDWKTNRRRSGEQVESMLERLRQEYSPQLEAYRQCVREFLGGDQVQVGVYATAAGVLRCW